MSIQTATYSPDFQSFLHLVDTSLAQAAVDARELAERTGTPLVVRTIKGRKVSKKSATANSNHIRKNW